jgi:hypothetical protein
MSLSFTLGCPQYPVGNHAVSTISGREPAMSSATAGDFYSGFAGIVFLRVVSVNDNEEPHREVICG